MKFGSRSRAPRNQRFYAASMENGHLSSRWVDLCCFPCDFGDEIGALCLMVWEFKSLQKVPRKARWAWTNRRSHSTSSTSSSNSSNSSSSSSSRIKSLSRMGTANLHSHGRRSLRQRRNYGPKCSRRNAVTPTMTTTTTNRKWIASAAAASTRRTAMTLSRSTTTNLIYRPSRPSTNHLERSSRELWRHPHPVTSWWPTTAAARKGRLKGRDPWAQRPIRTAFLLAPIAAKFSTPITIWRGTCRYTPARVRSSVKCAVKVSARRPRSAATRSFIRPKNRTNAKRAAKPSTAAPRSTHTSASTPVIHPFQHSSLVTDQPSINNSPYHYIEWNHI